MRYNYIAVEGNIGVGKTTLACKIAHQFNGKLILEQFEGNPFLVKFYQNQEKYAFPLELSFLAERYQQLKRELANQDLFTNFTISDYFINKSLIFARKTLNPDEYQLFLTLFNIMNANLPRPDLLVHLFVQTPRLQKNIKARGREYEQQIPDEYLDKIQESYLDNLKQQPQLRILMLDINNLDFVSSLADFNKIVDVIDRDYPKGITLIEM
ncbi:MAG TPA: deoxynucleoside kinase [Bacteroidales bacterium]|nr:deoxynucleoside kinase [Bacteroidales bacterium]